MAKKVLKSALEIKGIAPNLLLKDVENTAPFIFTGEVSLDGKERAYLAKLVFYKKNKEAMKYLGLTDYFYLCMASHWATAGTFVPTNVDNQIREGLWKHKETEANLDKMIRMTVDSWLWNYEQVTNRKSYNLERKQVLSTHEGTWLSVAIGAYCATEKYKRADLQEEMMQVILSEIEKEEKLLLRLREERDHINFLRSTALMAHNFGDLDRVIDQWGMSEDHPFRKRIYKLGHKLNEFYSPILVYAGEVNKKFLSLENHRHMSMRQPKCLRLSHEFLIPVGPFMDEWGMILGASKKLTNAQKGEIICAFFEGFRRQDQAFGYARAYRGLVSRLTNGLEALVADIPYDVIQDIKKSKFQVVSEQNEEEFVQIYKDELSAFISPMTGMKF